MAEIFRYISDIKSLKNLILSFDEDEISDKVILELINFESSHINNILIKTRSRTLSLTVHSLLRLKKKLATSNFSYDLGVNYFTKF
jgi:hypothetical protein